MMMEVQIVGEERESYSDLAMFVLNNTILLWHVWESDLMDYTCFGKYITHIVITKFITPSINKHLILVCSWFSTSKLKLRNNDVT